MAFIQIDGLPGKVYVPDLQPGGAKKYPCPDCHCCQGCSEERCRACRGRSEQAADDPDRQAPGS